MIKINSVGNEKSKRELSESLVNENSNIDSINISGLIPFES